MRTGLLILLAVLIIACIWLRPWIGISRTPELLGDAPIVLFRSGDSIFGLMWNGYALFWLEGHGDQRVECTLTRIAGGEVGGAGESIACLMVWRDAGKFRGWIEFRGHPRAFCGVELGADFPRVCLWR